MTCKRESGEDGEPEDITAAVTPRKIARISDDEDGSGNALNMIFPSL